MIDFHSHIIYEVDDGSVSLENSLEILKKAEKAGFNEIILTPHYMKEHYEHDKQDIEEKIQQLKNICLQERMDITLYQANEIYITNHISGLLQQEIACSINNSRYVLFELPMNDEPLNLLEVIYSLKENGYIPIIAHPERYAYIQKNPNKLLPLIEMGVLFQANYGSVIGQYGKQVKKTVKLLLQNNFIHFLGTDVHKNGNIYENINEIMIELSKIIKDKKIKELAQDNIRQVLNDEELEIEEPIKIKQGLFTKFF